MNRNSGYLNEKHILWYICALIPKYKGKESHGSLLLSN